MKARGFWMLDEISDDRLVGELRALLASEGRTEARVVAHLAELEVRRLALKGAQSLFEYCQKSLGFSENQAYYRIAAARVARRFPIVFELLERRELHLTSLAPLSKHLTEENHLELLCEAGGLSRRELLKLLARRVPRPDVPSQIRRLVPGPGAVAAGPTGSLEPLSETSYRLQLNTSEALKQKLELARDLMSHANPSGDLAVVVERALDLLIDKLQARRFGQTAHPRGKASEIGATSRAAPQVGAASRAAPPVGAASRAAPPVGAASRAAPPVGATSRAADDVGAAPRDEGAGELHFDRSKRGARAHIGHEIRRRLLERDGLCCSYVAADGRRCAARAFLQIHHEKPWARGGADSFDNLRLLCQAHNQLLAERDYGALQVAAAMDRQGRAPGEVS